MTEVIRKPINSDPSLDTLCPWYNLTFKDGKIEVIDGNLSKKECCAHYCVDISPEICATYNGETEFDDLGLDDIPVKTKFAETMWVFATDLDGEFLFRPHSELPPVLGAHLGFYYPKTDKLILLEFKDENDPANEIIKPR